MTRLIDNKRALIRRLRVFGEVGHPNYHDGRGDRVIARGLADFFADTPWLPEETPGNAYVYYLDRWLVDAFDTFRTSQEPNYVRMRDRWKEEMEGHCDEIPDLINLGVSNPVWASLTGDSCARILRVVTQEEWLYAHIKAYLGAQADVVMRRGLAQHAPSEGASRWELTPAGREAIAKAVP